MTLERLKDYGFHITCQNHLKMETPMRKIAIGVIAICLSAYASFCFGAYLIHLKDGREIITNQYWEEGSQIKLHRYGGIIGIPKDQIVRIEETDEILEEKKTTVVKPTPDKHEKPTSDEGRGNSESAVKKGEKSSKSGNGKAEKPQNELLKEFDVLKKRFKNVESMSKKEIYQFDKDLTGLRNKILKAGLAGPYANQLTEILSMGSKAEEVLKKRAQ